MSKEGAFSDRNALMVKNFTLVWFTLVSVAFIYLWITEAWFHIELLTVSEYVRDRGFLSVFDWSLFDSHPARLRPLSDFFEVVDAILRPNTVWFFGHHPSLSLSSIIIAISSAALFYDALRSMKLSRNEAFIFTGLFITTIGFLSCFVPYIRPAKRLVLLGLCALFSLIFRYKDNTSNRSEKTFGCLLALVLLLSFFSDEAGFIYWLIVPLFIASKLNRSKLCLYYMIPLVYLFLAKIIFPSVYNFLGKSGPRDGVLDISIISNLLSNILSIDFYKTALEDLGRAVVAQLGILQLPSLIPIVIVIIVGSYAIKKRAWVTAALSFSLIVVSFFLSMIDTVNLSRNIMGEWAYYYHSPIACITILWMASIYNWQKPSSKKVQIMILICFAILSLLNVVNFYRINKLIKIIHTYPLVRLEPRIFNEDMLAIQFEKLLTVFPLLPQTNELRSTFTYYRAHPMGDNKYANRLEQIYKKQVA